MLYFDGTQVQVGDHIMHSTAAAVVEELIKVDDLANWGLEQPGFMIICDQCSRVLIEPGDADWEDVRFVRRAK